MTAKENQALQQITRSIGTKLTQLRIQKGYTSSETFAYSHDLPRVQYWRIENGHANLTIKSLVRVLAAHQLTIHEFFNNR